MSEAKRKKRTPEWVKLVRIMAISVVVSFLLAEWLVSAMDNANSGAIDACDRLGGQITYRGYNCFLPTGELVDPEKWEAHQ